MKRAGRSWCPHRMSEQFICISCWKEFVADEQEISQRGGKIICPFCGYLQPAPTDVFVLPSTQTGKEPKLENPGGPTNDIAEEITWTDLESSSSEDFQVPITEEEHTDRIEIPAEFQGFEKKFSEEEARLDKPEAEEPTPTEGSDQGLLDRQAELFGQTLAEGDSQGEAVLVREEERKGKPLVRQASEWHLRTPTGLTFKFTDPEVLLSWKKKLVTYKTLEVSPDGSRWVDFARFVREYERVGDPLKSFILSESSTDIELPPKPLHEDAAQVEKPTLNEQEADDEKRQPPTMGHHFTFKVKEERNTGWGKYLLLAILGLGLGAGIVFGVLYFTGRWPPPI